MPGGASWRVFFTPAIVSGTADMPPYRFAFWNLLDSLGWSLSVAASAYGVGRLATGHHTWRDIAILIIGLGAGALVIVVVRHRRRRRTTVARIRDRCSVEEMTDRAWGARGSNQRIKRRAYQSRT
jgi:hypothetical protein